MRSSFISEPFQTLISLNYQAFIVSVIAHCDWPDHYPTLLGELINLLSSNSPESVHGAMQVFTEFVRSDLTEDQLIPVLRQLLPILMAILGSPQVGFIFPVPSDLFTYSRKTRT